MSIIYGADYNPEQWSKEVWFEDMLLMQQAGVTMVNLNIFGWAIVEPEDGRYDFTMLKTLMDLLYDHGIAVDLATGTAAQPAWLSTKYQVLPKDQQMNTIWYGSRQSYCPNSFDYKRKAGELVRATAEHFKDHPALKMWHINNEYSDHIGVCYCQQCAHAFRLWLKDRYSLSEINDRWGTAFWSQKYYSFDEIIPPRQTSGDPNPGLVLDYRRFMSDSILALYQMEKEILRKITPEIPVTSNFMGNGNKPLDYFKWAKDLDVISWDSYPDVIQADAHILNAMTHDLMRSLKKEAFIMMEQATSQVNWRKVNPNKRPGQMRALSHQCLMHGGKGIMFFQWRQSKKGAEKFHSGMIPHAGPDSRIFREVVSLGQELKALDPIKVKSQVAILFDYDTWWAMEYTPGPSEKMRYMDLMMAFYTYCYHNNIQVDFVGYDENLTDYKCVILPNAYLTKTSLVANLKDYLTQGGHLICGPFSGIVDESDTVTAPYPGPLSDLLGIRVEEYDVRVKPIRIAYKDKVLLGTHWAEVLHGQGIAFYEEDYYKGCPAVTHHAYGRGHAHYIASVLDQTSLAVLLDDLMVVERIHSPAGLAVRETDQGLYMINFTPEEVVFTWQHETYVLAPYAVYRK